MEKREENVNKIVYFLLGTEMRAHDGAEIALATDLSADEINDVVNTLTARGLLADEGPDAVAPYRFGAVRITPKAIALFQQSRQTTGCSGD
jgi:hypothetical protein